MPMKVLKDVRPVSLGGVNKHTKKTNPTSLTGYFLRTELHPSNYRKGETYTRYVFLTAEGEVSLGGGAGLAREMKKATPGRLTQVVRTGEKLDTGKGNPMELYSVSQDDEDTVDVDEYTVPTPVTVIREESTVEEEEYPEQELTSDDEETGLSAYAVSAPKKTTMPASPSPERVAKMKDLLKKSAALR